MMDANEIINLLEKINVMVSENSPHCAIKVVGDEDEREHLDQNANREEEIGINSSVFLKNQKGKILLWVDPKFF